MSVNYDPKQYLGAIDAEEQRAIVFEFLQYLDAILDALVELHGK